MKNFGPNVKWTSTEWAEYKAGQKAFAEGALQNAGQSKVWQRGWAYAAARADWRAMCQEIESNNGILEVDAK